MHVTAIGSNALKKKKSENYSLLSPIKRVFPGVFTGSRHWLRCLLPLVQPGHRLAARPLSAPLGEEDPQLSRGAAERAPRLANAFPCLLGINVIFSPRRAPGPLGVHFCLVPCFVL